MVVLGITVFYNVILLTANNFFKKRQDTRADPGFEVKGGANGNGLEKPGDGVLYKHIQNTLIFYSIYLKYDIFQIRFLIQYSIS